MFIHNIHIIHIINSIHSINIVNFRKLLLAEVKKVVEK